jgi:hypothetical protein
MTSDSVNAVAASLRSTVPKALVGKMYERSTSTNSAFYFPPF